MSLPPTLPSARHISGVVLCPPRACHAVITAIGHEHGQPYVQWCSLLHGPVDCEQRCLSTLSPNDTPHSMSATSYRALRPVVQRVYEHIGSQQLARFPTWQRWAEGLLAGVGTARSAWHAAETVRTQTLELAPEDPDRNLALAAELVAWACVQAYSGRDAEAAECAAQAHRKTEEHRNQNQTESAVSARSNL